MKLVSVNVGLPRSLSWQGAAFETGIFKNPVAGRIMLRKTNLDGDRQADLSVHGGANKAVYGYPSEHYSYWTEALRGTDLTWGAFGENFTSEGLLEADVFVGGHYRVGTAEIMVTTPRLPCFKLAAKFQRDDIIQRFLRSGRSGYYFSVLEEGEVAGGDEFEFLGVAEPRVTIAEINDLYISSEPDLELLRRAVQVRTLPESWRDRFQAKLDAVRGERSPI